MREDKIEQKYISILKKMDGNKRVEVSYGKRVEVSYG